MKFAPGALYLGTECGQQQAGATFCINARRGKPAKFLANSQSQLLTEWRIRKSKHFSKDDERTKEDARAHTKDEKSRRERAICPPNSAYTRIKFFYRYFKHFFGRYKVVDIVLTYLPAPP